MQFEIKFTSSEWVEMGRLPVPPTVGDIVLLNPLWEKVRLEPREFRIEKIVFNARTPEIICHVEPVEEEKKAEAASHGMDEQKTTRGRKAASRSRSKKAEAAQKPSDNQSEPRGTWD